MDDWITVRQAAHILDVSMPRVYALVSAGTLSSRKMGLTRMINRKSVLLYKDSPDRNKYASGRQASLFDPEQAVLPIGDADGAGDDVTEWSGLKPPTLSAESRRLYDATWLGQREARMSAQAKRGEV